MTRRRVLRLAVRAGGPWTVVLAATALLSAGAELLLPVAVGRAVDGLADADQTAGRWLLACVLLVATIAVAETVADVAAGFGTARATAHLRRRLARHVLFLAPHATERGEGDLVTRIVGQAADAGRSGTAVVLTGAALVAPLGSVVALSLLDPWLGATFVGGLVLLALLMRAYLADATDATERYQENQSDIATRLVEALGGSRTIAAAATTDREVGRILEPLPALARDGRRGWDAVGRAASRGVVVAPLLQIAVVAVAGFGVAAGRLTPGMLVAALQYAALGAGLGSVVTMLGELARVRAGCGRTAEVLAEPVRAYGEADVPPGTGRLELCGVTVRQGGAVVLDGIDLSVPGGTTLAVVGRSGAGKSALAAVAGRLTDPSAGEVRLDGVPLRRLHRPGLRRAVGYAFARPTLVGRTVGDAIALGRPSTATTEVRAAARAAQVDGVISRLPRGYATRLADAPMSGGEVQRIGLARALRAERLLVLDDAMSSLDTATEHQVCRALIDPNDPRTRILTTHRAATADRADLVAWLEDGRLRAIAPHRVLWRDPQYRALFEVTAG